jgi:hypothetical protein
MSYTSPEAPRTPTKPKQVTPNALPRAFRLKVRLAGTGHDLSSKADVEE